MTSRSRARPSTRSTWRSTAASKRRPTSSSRWTCAAACSGRSRSARASRGAASHDVDLDLAHEIARRAAQAIDNALLFGAAQQSYAQLDTLLVSAPVGIGFWDRELRFVRVNDALAELNGRPPDEHIGKTLAQVIPDLAATLEPLYRRVLETGEPVVHEESTDEAIAGPGDARHWLSSYYPVRGADGETTGVGGVIMEITGQKRADARLRLLAEAGEHFSSSLDREEILRRISRVVVPRIADACNIYLADGDALERVAHAHADPELEQVMDSMPDHYDLGPSSAADLPQRLPQRRGAARVDAVAGARRSARAARARPGAVREGRLTLDDVRPLRLARGDTRRDDARLTRAGALQGERSRAGARARAASLGGARQRPAGRRAAAPRAGRAGARVRRRRGLPRRQRGDHPALEPRRGTDHRPERGRRGREAGSGHARGVAARRGERAPTRLPASTARSASSGSRSPPPSSRTAPSTRSAT